jgi:uncharacterized protein (TIGR00255 family)
MTGFGRAAFSVGGEDFIVEVKSLNHRYLDIKTRLPEAFSSLETEIRSIIKERIARGSVVVSIQPGASARRERLDMEAARAYLEAAREIKKVLKVSGEVNLDLLMRQKGIFTDRNPALDEKALRAGLRDGLGRALTALVKWREKEGRNLVKDIKKRLRSIKASLRKIEKALPRVRKAHTERIASRIADLSEDALNEPAVLVEAAVFAERTDITEEMVRLSSHLEAFGSYLAAAEGGSLGKRLDFLAQEVFRELNTIASKAQDAFISQTIVSMKCELEKIREQVQNLE